MSPTENTILPSNPHSSNLLCTLNLPWCHPTTVHCPAGLLGPLAHIPWLVSSTWGTAFGHCAHKTSTSTSTLHTPAWACSQDTSRCVQAPPLGSRAGQICSVTFILLFCGCPHLGALAAAPVQRAQAAPPVLTLPGPSWRFMVEPLQGWTLCLGCSSTTHIVLEMIHHVHVATRRVWQGKSWPICTFLPEKHEPPLSLTAEQQ